MQAAFGFTVALPSARSFVIAQTNRLSAMGATDARVATVMKRVIGQIVSNYIPPDISPAPANQRIDFDAIPSAIPFNNLGQGSGWRLFAANSRNPCVKPFERHLEWLDLSEAAA